MLTVYSAIGYNPNSFFDEPDVSDEEEVPEDADESQLETRVEKQKTTVLEKLARMKREEGIKMLTSIAKEYNIRIRILDDKPEGIFLSIYVSIYVHMHSCNVSMYLLYYVK